MHLNSFKLTHQRNNISTSIRNNFPHHKWRNINKVVESSLNQMFLHFGTVASDLSGIPNLHMNNVSRVDVHKHSRGFVSTETFKISRRTYDIIEIIKHI